MIIMILHKLVIVLFFFQYLEEPDLKSKSMYVDVCEALQRLQKQMKRSWKL